MKNYEKYADEIRGYGSDKICSEFIKPYILKSDTCGSMTCSVCCMCQMLWLLEEYEEPEVDWNKVEVDTPILVRNSEDQEWLRRHFARYESRIVYTWKDSRTSWTELNDKNVTEWKYAKLAESEEK